MPKIFLKTWGCTLNQSDSDIIRAILEEHGYQFTDNVKNADVIVLNTCTVKSTTENKILSELANLYKSNTKIVVAGCLSINNEKIRKIAPLASIVGTGATNFISEAVECALIGKPKIFKTFQPKCKLPRKFSQSIARIPICEGCIGKCTFCQTRFARPFLISYPIKEVVRMVESAVDSGAKEIQLTGMDVGAYGLDFKSDLVSLLRALVKINRDFKMRLGMINPQHAKRMKQGLIRIFKHKKMFKFLHIPVQTGSEKVCKEMKRAHTVADFEDVVEKFRKEIPDITIATDIIVAYPTESEEDYKLTLQLLRRTQPDIVNLSRFMVRAGTEAKMLKQLKTEIAKKRTREVHVLIRKIAAKNAQKFLARKICVLITEIAKKNQIKGRAENYRQIVIKKNAGIPGNEIRVKVIKANHSSLFGKII